MKKYLLSVTRVTTYEVEAEDEKGAIDVLITGLAVEDDEITLNIRVEEIKEPAA